MPLPQTKATILIVDDEASVLKLFRAILEPDGYEVMTSESGYSAYSLMTNRLQALGEAKIHLVITDWKMAGWDGMRLLGEIRGNARFKDVAVVLMSGAVTREELIAAAQNKADSVLVKPIKKDNLLAKVTEVLTKRFGPPEN